MDNFPYIDRTDFNPGALMDRIDPRDYKWADIGSALPPFDWSKHYSVTDEIRAAIDLPSFTIPVKNQNGSGSCGGQAWSYYGANIEALATKSFEERSAKFIYSQTYVHVPGGGSAGRDNSELVKKAGWGLESLTSSYDNGQAPSEYFMERAQDITDIARQTAKKATAVSYANVQSNIDMLAQAIQYNHGTIIGIVGQNNGTWNSVKPLPPSPESSNNWYHWLYAGEAGMYDGEKAIRVLNSWGNAAGDQGWQWITESYINAALQNDPFHNNKTIFSAWTLMYNTNPGPATLKHHFGTNMAQGQQSDEVKILQQALTITGDFPSSIAPTGYYGNETAHAVLKFQNRSGITPPASTNVGPKTRAALNVLFDK